MRGIRAPFDIVSGIAARQHGRVRRDQLVAAGVDRDRVRQWLEDGRLRRVHHGVYAVGHLAQSLYGDLMAAVLACGDGAVLSHCPAAYVVRIVASRPVAPEVTVPTTAGRRRPGIVIHRVAILHPLDVASHYGIPITTIPRVLLDLAPRLSPPELACACHEAWIHHRTSPRHVEACIARNPRKPGANELRRALGSDITLSVLVDGFLQLLERHGLPAPRPKWIEPATRSTATGPSTTSSWSWSATASTHPGGRSRPTSRAAGARATSRSPTATCSSARGRRRPRW